MNNQIYALLCVTSALTSRASRLTLLYLGFLFEFAICAFFFDLDQESDDLNLDSSSFSVEALSENFWVGLYAVLLSYLPLALVALCFRVTSRKKASLRLALNQGHPQTVHSQLSNKQRYQHICGLFGFILISLFLLAYIVGFCVMANEKAERDWIVSSLFAVALDLAAFEIVPAFAVGCLGLCIGGCKVSCLSWVVYLLTCCRSIRSFVGT